MYRICLLFSTVVVIAIGLDRTSAAQRIAAQQESAQTTWRRNDVERFAAGLRKTTSPEDISRYERHLNPTAAVLAAWRRCELNADFTKDSLARFVGFLESRVGIILPQWYIDCLYASGAVKAKVSDAPAARVTIENIQLRPTISISGVDFHIPKVLTVRVEDGRVAFQVGGEKATVMEDALGVTAQSGDQLIAHLSDTHVLVAFCNRYGSGFQLSCFNRKSGELLWRSDVWADGAEKIHGKSGAWAHYVTAEIQGDKCLLVGYNRFFYCEAFNLADGKSIGRWSSSYWNVPITSD